MFCTDSFSVTKNMFLKLTFEEAGILCFHMQLTTSSACPLYWAGHGMSIGLPRYQIPKINKIYRCINHLRLETLFNKGEHHKFTFFAWIFWIITNWASSVSIILVIVVIVIVIIVIVVVISISLTTSIQCQNGGQEKTQTHFL